MLLFFKVNDSWDELGNYDIPAVIKFILDKTGQPKLSYVGYSLGSAMFFIAMSKHPELNSKIEMMVCTFIYIFKMLYNNSTVF